MTEIGELAWWAALLLAFWGAGAAFIASRRGARGGAFGESASRALEAAAALLVLAAAGVIAYLRAGDLGFTFTAESTSANLPRAWRLAALLSRDGGSLLLAAALAALLGALAGRRARATPAFAGVVCAAVFAALAWAAATDPPFARVAAIPRDGAGLAPAWQMPWTPAARALALGVAALLVIVAACRAARLPARGWTLAAMTVGACAIAAAMRRGLTGPPIGFLEGGLLAVSLVVPVAARRDVLGARAWRVFVAALAAAGIALAAGAAWGSRAALPLGGTAPATARGPAGATWTFTSDGLSVYEEQNRHVTAVLVDVRRGSSRVGVARAEWRDYLGASGEPLGDGAPYGAVLAAPFTYTTVGLAMPPAGEDVVLDVRFAPLFWLWWLFAALAAAAAAIAAAGPAAVASRGEAG